MDLIELNEDVLIYMTQFLEQIQLIMLCMTPTGWAHIGFGKPGMTCTKLTNLVKYVNKDKLSSMMIDITDLKAVIKGKVMRATIDIDKSFWTNAIDKIHIPHCNIGKIKTKNINECDGDFLYRTYKLPDCLEYILDEKYENSIYVISCIDNDQINRNIDTQTHDINNIADLNITEDVLYIDELIKNNHYICQVSSKVRLNITKEMIYGKYWIVEGFVWSANTRSDEDKTKTKVVMISVIKSIKW